ncbi:CBS domain-containing protein [Gandjariella thermophila]|uniref:CBS domain-containing protein n=1 Tax=Gandjariella thermophila TaxID=1931992 RepID=A0A4D4J400_9PSEU|nr:CBS domain-containing protein [Gandjariella thermophila]GDY28693.1 CBS domain-containing protein [Gandjariella thermophila]
MRVTDIMRCPVVCAHPGTTVRVATALLVDNAFTALPVVEPDGRLVGIVTEADLLRGTVRDARLAAAGTARGTPVAEVMSSPVATVPAGATLPEVREAMSAHGRRCLPVVDEAGTPLGVVSRGDVLRTLLREDEMTAAKVRRLLADYTAGQRDWTVHVTSGLAVVSGEFADEAEQGMVTALVRTAPGVTGVVLRPRYALAGAN